MACRQCGGEIVVGRVGLLDGLCSKCRGFTPEQHVERIGKEFEALMADHAEHNGLNARCPLCIGGVSTNSVKCGDCGSESLDCGCPFAPEAEPKPCKSGHLLPTETCRDCDFMPEHDPLSCKNGDHEDCFRAQLFAIEADAKAEEVRQ